LPGEAILSASTALPELPSPGDSDSQGTSAVRPASLANDEKPPDAPPAVSAHEKTNDAATPASAPEADTADTSS
jgi:hypothetical protein